MLFTMSGRELVADWLERYERAWRSPGTAAVRELFTDEATYQLDPYDDPIAGIDAIAAMWEREREGPDEQFTMRSEIVAVEGETAVVRVEVRYRTPAERDYRDLWVLRLRDDGRCSAFEEWPFWPERSRIAPGAPGA
jgi:ketosteroid isomerase-like protein